MRELKAWTCTGGRCSVRSLFKRCHVPDGGGEPLSRFFYGFFLLNGRNLFPSQAGPSVTGGMVFEGRRSRLLHPQRVPLSPKYTPGHRWV